MRLQDLRDKIDQLIEEHGNLPVVKYRGGGLARVYNIFAQENVSVLESREIGGYYNLDKAAIV